MNILAHNIIELFEELLDEKGIEIPCEFYGEQQERYRDGNDAKIYGTEYGDLYEKICLILEGDAYYDKH